VRATRVLLVIMFLASASDAKRRKNFLPADDIEAYGKGGDYGQRLLLGLALQAGHDTSAGPQVHVFVTDRLGIGARIRLAEVTTYEAEVAVSPARWGPAPREPPPPNPSLPPCPFR